MDPVVWGPHYWFVLHTIASNYPTHPTSIQKKIHYRLVHNLHEFIPHRASANRFSALLTAFPVAPYLDSRSDFIRWMHMIHNKVNAALDHPSMSLHRHKEIQKDLYAPTASRLQKHIKETNVVVYVLFVGMLGAVILLNR